MSAAHLDYDTLAELAEGLLPDSQVASADAHLADCAECRTRSAEIADVSRLLADAAVPPMPAEMASRIDEALAEAAAADGPVASLDSRRGRRRAWVLSAAAAAVVVVGGGTLVGRALLTGSMSSDTGTAQSQPVQDRSGSAAAQPPRASALKAPAGAAAGSGGTYPTSRSGTDYTAARLGRQVAQRLASAADRTTEEVAPAALAGCVRQVTGGRMPLVVDVAKYEGRPATVIVLPGDDSDRVDVWVVGPTCSSTDPAVIKHAQATR